METCDIVVCGLVTADERGFHKKKLFVFGETFDLEWQEVKDWAIVNVGVASMQTRAEEYMFCYLELQTASRVFQIRSSDTGGKFAILVNYIRTRLPDKETESVMEKVQKLMAQMPPKS